MTNVWKVFVHAKASAADHRGEEIKREWSHAGQKAVAKVRSAAVYELSGVAEPEARRMADRLLADPVVQEAVVLSPNAVAAPAGARLAQIWPKPGVADPVADTVRLAAGDLKVQGLEAVRSGHAFEFHGAASADDVRRFCEERLMNALVQKVEVI